MPNITFDDKELSRVKSRQGVYGNLNRSPIDVTPVEIAFKKYARAHGCKENMVQTEWKRFEKMLLKELRSK